MLVFHVLFQTLFDQRYNSIRSGRDALEFAVVNGECRVCRLLLCNDKEKSIHFTVALAAGVGHTIFGRLLHGENLLGRIREQIVQIVFH